jgi:GT2 family glycosyltransferase
LKAAQKSLSVIIPNYNGAHLLEKYLPFTLAVVEESETQFEIIVVDDGSTDNSVAFLKANYPQVKIVVNPKNSGFSYTCNRGIDVAKNEVILLLNSDVKLLPGYFDEQWAYFDHEDTFGVMGRIIDMEGDHIQDAARVPKFNGLKLKTDYFYYRNSSGANCYTYYLSGANALINAAKLKAIGGFCELFSPFYCEDNELSIRAWRMGWKCYYEHKSVCRHQMSASTKNYQTARWVKSIYFRNRFYMHFLHLDGVDLIGWFLQITLIDLLPKVLIGQTWIWVSYISLFKQYSLLQEYKRYMKLLFNNKSESVVDVVRFIRSSVNDEEVRRFKP